ncbi:hypothetical protein QFZ91_006115 [Paraburkholderia sp. JPY419]
MVLVTPSHPQQIRVLNQGVIATALGTPYIGSQAPLQMRPLFHALAWPVCGISRLSPGDLEQSNES